MSTRKYRIELKPQAQKFIVSQDKKIQRQLIRRIEALEHDPWPQNSKLLHAKERLYRITSGNYRIIYQIQDQKLLVVVVKVGNRKDIYKQFFN